MLSLMSNIFAEQRKRGFLPQSNSSRQLVLQYVKANMSPSYIARVEILTLKWQQGISHSESRKPDVNSWKGNSINMDYYGVLSLPQNFHGRNVLLRRRTLYYYLISVYCQEHWQKPRLSCYRREDSANHLLFFLLILV